jgi:HEAT repeat protein
MAVRKVEHELEQLGLLREAPSGDARARLRKALKDPVNLMVAKAAAIAAERHFRDLTPDLLRAFDRLFGDAARRDPKCWGKNAIAKALIELEYRESAPYLRGMRHIQMEAGWGAAVDTADILRGICVLGMVASTDMRREEVFRVLIDAAGDSSEPVRVEAVRAIAQMEGEEAPLLLRLTARMGDPAAAVMGHSFDALLALEGEGALPFVAGFLRSMVREVREEAALSLGSSRLAGAVALLRQAWEDPLQVELREVLLRALSLTRQEEALAFLLDLVRNGRLANALAAVQALALHQEMRQQVETAASGREAEVRTAFCKAFGPQMNTDERG